MKKNLKNKLTKEMLEYEYNLCGSMQKVADKLQVSVDSVKKYMKLYSIGYSKNFTGYYSCNSNIFSEESEDTFYWAGFIAADGSLQKRKYSKILKITLSDKDLEHLIKFKKFLSSNHPIKNYKIKPSKLVKRELNSVEIQITNKKIFDDLLKFNITPNKTHVYSIPDWMLIHPLARHYLRGYFDGDGTISACGIGKNRTVLQGAFSIIGAYNFINCYRYMLVNNANLNCVKITKDKNIYKISYSGNNNIKKIYKYLYLDATIYLNRKKIKFLNFMAP